MKRNKLMNGMARLAFAGSCLLFAGVTGASGGSFDFVAETTATEHSVGFRVYGAARVGVSWDGGATWAGPYAGADVLLTNNYGGAGTRTISVTGTATRIAFAGTSCTPRLLRDITSRLSDGVSGITSADSMFSGCTGITSFAQADWFDAASANVTSMEYMFNGATAFNQDLGGWDVSRVDSMRALFSGASAFNNGGSDSIKHWNVTGVKNTNNQKGMRDMFRGTAFNQPIGIWNVSNVVSMGEMFRDSRFNQDIGQWNTLKLRNVGGMFYNSPFNQDISAKVVHAGLPGEYIAWDVSRVASFNNLFLKTPFNQDIGNWDTSGATTLDGMFESNTAFDQDISTKEVTVGSRTYTAWDVSRISDMSLMFRYSSGFKHDISNWVVTNVTTFSQFMNSVPYPTANYDKLLAAWSRLPLKRTVTYSGGTGKYSLEGAGGRVTIIRNFGWTFGDGGLVSLAEYPVATPLALQGCAMHPDKKYRLAGDIDLSDTALWNDGAGFWPIGTDAAPFSGTFAGQGRVLAGLHINRPALAGVGLFGKITGTVKALGLTGAVSGSNQVGGVFGTLAAGGVVEDCYARVAVTAAAADCHRGGFGGRNAQGAVRRVYATGAVRPIGGVDGGGLVGRAETGGAYADEDNFWDMPTSGWSTSAMGTGKTSDQMKNIATYANWDIAKINVRVNDRYPYLSGQAEDAPMWLISSPPGTVISVR